MKKLLYILPIAALLFVGCDKIEMNDAGIYGTEAGANSSWKDGNGVSDKAQRAFIEKYTGCKCVNCPAADELIHNLLEAKGGKAIAVAVESHTSFGENFSGNPSLRCEDGLIWSEYYGAEQLPACLVNRIEATPFITMADIATKVDNIIAQNAKVAIAVSNQQNGDKSEINVDLEFLETVSDDLTLTLLIMEDSVLSKQSNGTTITKDYPHHHMLRDVITDPWGAQISKEDVSGAQGEKKVATFTYTPNNEWKKRHCHYVAFISKKDTKEVLNIAECSLLNE